MRQGLGAELAWASELHTRRQAGVEESQFPVASPYLGVEEATNCHFREVLFL